MKFLVLLPLLAAAASASPAGRHAAINPLVQPYHVAHVAAPAVTYTHQVQVPLTKTVHYETKPVVTGYQTTILKPTIHHAHHPVLAPVVATQPIVAAPAQVVAPAPAPVVVEQQPQPADVVVEQPAPAPAPEPVQVVEEPAPAPIQSDAADTVEIENPEFRSAAVPAEQPAVAAVRSEAIPVAQAVPATVTGVSFVAPLGSYPQPYVSQERVLAPVRTHTQITPQITQIQPEVTVRKVIHDVPVAGPVTYSHTQYIHHQPGAIQYI